MAERLAGAFRRVRPSSAGIRIRTAVLATAVVAIALAAASVSLVVLQRRSLTDNIDTTVTQRADDITPLLVEGTLPEKLTVLDFEVSLVQVLDGRGEIILASENVAGEAPVTGNRPERGKTEIQQVTGLPIDHDEGFRVLTRGVETQSGVFTVIVAGSMDAVNDSTETLISVLLWGIPLLLIFVSGGIWLLVGRALSPVESIRREVASITGQQLSRRVPEPSAGDEIGRLARTMNEMLDRLESAQAQQDRFVGDASHELRSPLASIRTQIEVNQSNPERARWQDTMGGVREEVIRMQRLIEDLLILTRSDAGEMQGQRSLVDLDDLVLTAIALQGDNGRAEIDRSAISGGQVRGDRRHLQLVVRNLLDNAVRHARSRVAVTLRESDGLVSLTVEDDGAGIPEAERDRIFDRFTRLDSARGRDDGGAGLGLSIVRVIVDAHGGSVTVGTSQAGGARFVVQLPAASRI